MFWHLNLGLGSLKKPDLRAESSSRSLEFGLVDFGLEFWSFEFGFLIHPF
jgi:hypothetical protein